MKPIGSCTRVSLLRCLAGSTAAAGLMIAAAVAVHSDAMADDAADLSVAREHFDKGVALFEKDDFIAALEQFELADQARHSPVIVYNIARARESLGQAQAAYDAYEAYVAQAGAQGEYLSAATVALSSIKARSTRLRVETEPAGATLRIDGVPLRDRSPATVLVFRGKHRVDAELEGWSGGTDVVAEGNGTPANVRLVRPKPASETTPAPRRVPRPPPGFEDLMAGVGLALEYTALVVKNKPDPAAVAPDTPAYRKSSLRFGVALETGYALSPRSILILRGNCGLGSTEKALFSLGTLSLSYSFLATRAWRVGGGGIVGSSDEYIGATYSPLFGARADDSLALGGNLAVGPMAEASYMLADDEDGQWALSISPSLLLGTGQGQSTLVVPLVIARRWY